MRTDTVSFLRPIWPWNMAISPQRSSTSELGEQLSGQYALYDFDYAHTEQLSLPRFCRTLRHDLPLCVFAYGLETLSDHDKDNYETGLHYLNAHREDIRDTSSAVVLWLTSQTAADLWQQAPDFADWQTANATFTLPDGWHVEPTPLGKLPLREAEALRHKARRFQEQLGRPNLEPALTAEFNARLAAILKQLGKTVESEHALSESSRTAAALADYGRLEALYRQHVVDRYGKLTLYSVSSDAPLAVDLERDFVKLTTTQRQRRAWRPRSPPPSSSRRPESRGFRAAGRRGRILRPSARSSSTRQTVAPAG